MAFSALSTAAELQPPVSQFCGERHVARYQIHLTVWKHPWHGIALSKTSALKLQRSDFFATLKCNTFCHTELFGCTKPSLSTKMPKTTSRFCDRSDFWTSSELFQLFIRLVERLLTCHRSCVAKSAEIYWVLFHDCETFRTFIPRAMNQTRP